VTAPEPTVLAGSIPLVLVAPHGGRRDPVRRPWGSTRLRVNDLHTASLTRELAAALGAHAVINQDLDRNDVDLNRVSAAHDQAPAFLERVADRVSAAIANHGRAVVLTVHGWNVIQPTIDLGVGRKRGEEMDARAAVSAPFADRAVPALMRACSARGVAATEGARYPARARENLVQLFTPRHRDDSRPLIRRLAALGARTEAMQCELGVPLRWPGVWRHRFIAACVEALPALLDPATAPAAGQPPSALRITQPRRRTLEIAGQEVGALVSTDAGGGRLLVFPPGGGVALFTGERLGEEEPGCVGGLRIDDGDDGALRVCFAGPMMRFPDTTPFVDLERGLTTAQVIEHAAVDLAFAPHHQGGKFGPVTGTAMLDGHHLDLGGRGFAAGGDTQGPWPRLRLALQLGRRERLSVTVGLDGGGARGVLCRDGDHRPVRRAAARLGDAANPLAGATLDVELADGERLTVRPEAVHQLPVVRGATEFPLRLLYASCRLPGVAGLAGWCEVGGL
jgi:hypothetical protein